MARKDPTTSPNTGIALFPGRSAGNFYFYFFFAAKNSYCISNFFANCRNKNFRKNKWWIFFPLASLDARKNFARQVCGVKRKNKIFSQKKYFFSKKILKFFWKSSWKSTRKKFAKKIAGISLFQLKFFWKNKLTTQRFGHDRSKIFVNAFFKNEFLKFYSIERRLLKILRSKNGNPKIMLISAGKRLLSLGGAGGRARVDKKFQEPSKREEKNFGRGPWRSLGPLSGPFGKTCRKFSGRP